MRIFNLSDYPFSSTDFKRFYFSALSPLLATMAMKAIELMAYGLAASYAFFWILSMALLVRLHYYVKAWTTQKVLVAFIASCSAMRLVFFALVNEWANPSMNYE